VELDSARHDISAGRLSHGEAAEDDGADDGDSRDSTRDGFHEEYVPFLLEGYDYCVNGPVVVVLPQAEPRVPKPYFLIKVAFEHTAEELPTNVAAIADSASREVCTTL
jgi:hypothetical protein